MLKTDELAPACGGSPSCVACRNHEIHLEFERRLTRDAESLEAARRARNLRELRESRRLGFSRRQVLILGTLALSLIIGGSMLAHSCAPSAQVVTK